MKTDELGSCFLSHGFENFGQVLAESGGVKVEMFNFDSFFFAQDKRCEDGVALQILILDELRAFLSVVESTRPLAERIL